MNDLQRGLRGALRRRGETDDLASDGKDGNRRRGLSEERPDVDGAVDTVVVADDGTGGVRRIALMRMPVKVCVNGASGVVRGVVVVGMRMDEERQHGGHRDHHHERSRHDRPVHPDSILAAHPSRN